MPKNISFALTIPQFKNRTKTVTRRLGWRDLKPGDVLNGCEQCMGLKKGETLKKLGQIVVIDTRMEPVNAITQADVIAEGFPDMTPSAFIDFFCKANHCKPDTTVNRIEYRYIYQQPHSIDIEQQIVNGIVRAFWRRVYPFRNDYGKELPLDMPIEFSASMGTALTLLRFT